MSAQVNSNSFQTVKYTDHPSMKLLAKFHGRIVKIFSPLKSEGKFLEVMKRVVLAVVSPFAYLALTLVGIIGYPYTTTGTRQVPIQENEDTSAIKKNQTSTEKGNNESDKVGTDSKTEVQEEETKLKPNLSIPKDKDIPKEIKTETSENLSNEATNVSEELKKLTQNIYGSLLKINNRSDSAFSSTSWQNWIFITTGEVYTTINDTQLTLSSFVNLVDQIKRELKLFSVMLTKNPEVQDKIVIPTIDFVCIPNRDTWKNISNHMGNCQSTLSSILFEDKFLDQLQLSYGDKGAWFSTVFKNLESVYDNYLKEYQNLCVSYDEFYNHLDPHNLVYGNTIKNMADKHKVTFKEKLDKLELKLKAFDLVDKNFEKIMELARKI